MVGGWEQTCLSGQFVGIDALLFVQELLDCLRILIVDEILLTCVRGQISTEMNRASHNGDKNLRLKGFKVVLGNGKNQPCAYKCINERPLMWNVFCHVHRGEWYDFTLVWLPKPP